MSWQLDFDELLLELEVEYEILDDVELKADLELVDFVAFTAFALFFVFNVELKLSGRDNNKFKPIIHRINVARSDACNRITRCLVSCMVKIWEGRQLLERK